MLVLNEELKNNLVSSLKNAVLSVRKQKKGIDPLEYVHLKSKNGRLTVTATDAHILYTEKIDYQCSNVDNLMSKKDVQSFLKNKKSLDFTEILTANKDNAISYPHTSQCIPNEFMFELVLQPCQLLSLLKGLKQTNDDIDRSSYGRKDRVIDITIKKPENEKDKATIIISRNNAFLFIQTVVTFHSYKKLEKDYTESFNIDYLIKALKSFDKFDIIGIKFMEHELRPILLTNATETKKCVVCPVKRI